MILTKTRKTAPAHIPVKKKVNAASVLHITNQEMKFQAVSSAQKQKQNMTVQLNISSVHLLNKTNILNSASFEKNLVLKCESLDLMLQTLQHSSDHTRHRFIILCSNSKIKKVKIIL